LSSGKRRTKVVASVAIFAVLYALLRLIPTFPMIGVSGAAFSLSDIIAPIYGVILGPLIGPLSVILGTFIAIALGKPVIFLFLDFLPATLNALVVGLILRRRFVPAIALNVIILAAFLANPLTAIFVTVNLLSQSIVLPFHWMHYLALAVLISPLSRMAAEWVREASTANLAKGLVVLSLIGTMLQQSTGSILYEVILGQYLGVVKPESWLLIWNTVFYIYPIERVVLVILATVVGTPIVRSLKASRLVYVE
jgi:hypothetical protein